MISISKMCLFISFTTSVALFGYCGDGVCSSNESCSDCVLDCGSCCGDAVCSSTENCASCQSDCGSCDTACPNVDEYPALCATKVSCNNTNSSVTESCNESVTCPSVDIAVCGDTVCQGTFGETGDTCSADCGLSVDTTCGNTVCDTDRAEDCENCQQDCGTCDDPSCTEYPKAGLNYPWLKKVGPQLETPGWFPIKLRLSTTQNIKQKGAAEPSGKKMKAGVLAVLGMESCITESISTGGIPIAKCFTASVVSVGTCVSKAKCAELAPLYQPEPSSICCQLNYQAQAGGAVKLDVRPYPSKDSIVRCEMGGSAALTGYLGGSGTQVGFGCQNRLTYPNSAGIKLKGNLEGSCNVVYAGQKYGVGSEGILAGCIGVKQGFQGLPGPFGYGYEYGIPPIQLGWLRISDWRYSGQWGMGCI